MKYPKIRTALVILTPRARIFAGISVVHEFHDGGGDVSQRHVQDVRRREL